MEKPKFEIIFAQTQDTNIKFIAYDSQKVDEYLDKLFKDAVEVFGDPTQSKWTEGYPVKGDTHQALLINIEEIKPKECEHEPMFKCNGIDDHSNAFVFGRYECVKCGKKLKAKWEVTE